MRVRDGRTALAAAAALALLAGTALSYKYKSVGGVPQRWPAARATVWVDGAMLPDRATAIRNATQTWSAVPGSTFRFVFGGSSPSLDVTDHANGNGDLYFDNSLPPFVFAVTYALESGKDIQERDVAFNGSLVWSTSGSPGTRPDVETVALHELGHVLGLLHEDGVPAVMLSAGDPTFPRRILEDDDRAGVVFLYPVAGGGGGGGGPKGPDLAAGTLLVTQGAPGRGKALKLRVEVKNRSTLPAGPFRVAATLVRALPANAEDEEVGFAEIPSLAGGGTTTVDIDVFIPHATPPGSWRLGAYVDPGNSLLDPVRDNNGAATSPFTIELAPLGLLLGDSMSAGLGPQGADGGVCTVVGGAEILLKVKGKNGVRPTLRILDGPGGAVLASASGRSFAKLSFKAPGDGDLVFEVRNGEGTVGRFLLKTSGRVAWKKVAAEAPGVLPFPAWAGGSLKASVLYDGEAALLGCRPPFGPDLSGPGAARGRKARFGPWVPDTTGEHALVLDGDGPVRVTLKARTPKRGDLLVR